MSSAARGVFAIAPSRIHRAHSRPRAPAAPPTPFPAAGGWGSVANRQQVLLSRPPSAGFNPAFLDSYGTDNSSSVKAELDKADRRNEEKWEDMTEISNSVVEAVRAGDLPKMDEIIFESDEVWKYLEDSEDLSDASSFMFFKTVSAALQNWIAPEYHCLHGRSREIINDMLDGLREQAWPLLSPTKPEEVAPARHAAGVLKLVKEAVSASDGGDPNFQPSLDYAPLPSEGLVAPGAVGEGEEARKGRFHTAVHGILVDGAFNESAKFLDGVYLEAFDGLVSFLELEGFEVEHNAGDLFV